MSEPIEIQDGQSPELQALIARSPGWPVAVRQGIVRGLNLENELTIGYIQRTKLSSRGPMTLGVVTNRLRSSLSRDDARISGDAVLSAIGSNVVYMRPHEEGFTGVVNVREHTRRLFSRETIGAQKYLDPKSGKIKRTRERHVKVLKNSVTVRAHEMRMNVPARAPIHTSLRERAPEYGRTLTEQIILSLRGQTPAS